MLCAALVAGLLAAPQPPAPPRTVPERTGFAATSTTADVREFVAALGALQHGDRLATGTYGTSGLGEPLDFVVASLDPSPDVAELRASRKLRALILANIHGGEVEGKEAVQVLLREIASGTHEDLLEEFELVFVPVFNADGNDRIDRRNRVAQNGPDRGVGERHNAQDLDLNRDYVKAESPEVRGLLGLFGSFDPDLYLDLHTTNGSEHGYHLTYSPSLSTSLDPELDAFLHDEFMPAVRAAMLSEHGFRAFDYGNFADQRQGASGEPGWFTYDHKPRLGFNYFGLRNRLGVLSEAYSYLDFEQRIAVTRAFVLENLRALIRSEERVRALTSRADARCLAGEARLGHDSDFAPPVRGEILVSPVARVELPDGLGVRRVAKASYETREGVPISVRFVARAAAPHPWAWAIVGASDAVRQTLLLHGIEVEILRAPVDVEAECFWPTAISKTRYVYQRHRPVRVAGDLAASRRTLPAGTLVVRARQRLARVAAALVDPLSEDSLATWNFFDDRIRRVDGPEPDGELAFPVVRLLREVSLESEPRRLADEAPRIPTLLDAPTPDIEDRITVRIVGEASGAIAAFEIDGTRHAGADELRAALMRVGDQLGKRVPIVLEPTPAARPDEILRAARAARDASFRDVFADSAKRE